MSASVRRALSIVMLVASVALIVPVPLMHPDSTRTRLFLDHWPLYALSFALALAALALRRAKP